MTDAGAEATRMTDAGAEARRMPDAARSRVALGLVLVAAVVLATRGPAGLVGAVALLLGWALLDTVLLFALGQVVVAASVGDVGALPQLVLVEVFVFGLLVVPALALDGREAYLGGLAVALVGLGGLAWSALVLSGSLIAAVLVVGGVAAAAAYYLHRYGRVVAGRYGTVPGTD
jgi:hypothetical protein